MIEVQNPEQLGEKRSQYHRSYFCIIQNLEYLLQPIQILGDSKIQKSVARLVRSASRFQSPEHINDNRHTSPSHRFIRAIPEYRNRKADVGPAATLAIGLPHLRATCPQFDAWISKLEALGKQP